MAIKNDVKTKLLDAVGEIDISDIGESALVDILVGKIKALEKEVVKLNNENGYERQRLYDETTRLREEQKRLRTDPFYGAHGEAYFLGNNGEKYRLHMHAGCVRELVMHMKKIYFPLQQVSPAQFDAA